MAFSSSDSNPFFLAIWANSTSWSIYVMGSNLFVLRIILICLGISLSIFPGKLATTTKIVHPMVIRMLAGSTKFSKFFGVTLTGGLPPKLIVVIMPNRQTARAPTTPMI